MKSKPPVPCKVCICRAMCINKSYDHLVWSCSIVGQYLYGAAEIFEDDARIYYNPVAVTNHGSKDYWRRLTDVHDELQPRYWQPEIGGGTFIDEE